MFSSVVVKSVSAIRKQLHSVTKLISKIHRYAFFSIVATCVFGIRKMFTSYLHKKGSVT